MPLFRSLAFAATAILVVACSAQTPSGAAGARADQAPKAAPVQVFDGFPLRGTAASVKKAGLTDCEPSGDTQLKCTLNKPVPVLGVMAQRVFVTLQAGKDETSYLDLPKLDTVKFEDLRYRGIGFEFKPTSYHQGCVDKATQFTRSPVLDACAEPDTMGSFRAALAEDGWISMGRRRNSEEFFQPEVPVIVEIYSPPHEPERATVSEISIEHVRQRVAAWRARREAQAHVPGKALIDEMKAPN